MGIEHVKLLVVDDEENFRQLLFRTLRKEGYFVRTAKDSLEALNWLRQEAFDLAILDIRMTPVDGFTLLSEIKNQCPGIKVIMITAFPAPETGSLCFRNGAGSYLTKPVEIHDLKKTIQSVLEQNSLNP